MTPQEAYNECKTFFENGGIGELDGVAFNMALNALEKQIPRKAKITPDTYPLLVCPSCNSKFILHEFKYCSRCGQAFDWSDTK